MAKDNDDFIGFLLNNGLGNRTTRCSTTFPSPPTAPCSTATSRIGCGIGRTSVLYNYDGTEYPCHMLLPVTTGDPHTIDKIKDID